MEYSTALEDLSEIFNSIPFSILSKIFAFKKTAKYKQYLLNDIKNELKSTCREMNTYTRSIRIIKLLFLHIQLNHNDSRIQKKIYYIGKFGTN